MRTLSKIFWAVRCPVAVLAVGAVLCTMGWCKKAHGQSKGASSSSGSGSGGSGDSGTAGAPAKGFAIESEMLTYTAMDSEAAAVSCNIAKEAGAADAGCAPVGNNGLIRGVVVVSDGSSALDEFQLWRTDISTMDMLTLRARTYCPAATQRGALSGLQSLMSLFPESEAVSFAQSLLSAQASTAPLEGNILDQTLLNDVAGHLRALGMSVVIPDMYMPHSLYSLDQAHSPFLVRFVNMVKARGCLAPSGPPKEEKGNAAGANGEQAPTPDQKAKDEEANADKLSIAQAIDGFLKSMSLPVDTQAAGGPGGQGGPGGGPGGSSKGTITHLSAVLRADGLAQQLGAGTSDEKSGTQGTWYVLWLKALESGGTLLKSGNMITGEKTSYSGGAVATYAFFKLDGNLECSGVFYNLAGPWQTKQIANMLPTDLKTPPGRLVGGCNPTP